MCNLVGIGVVSTVKDNPIAADIFDRLRGATAKDPAVLEELCRDYLSEAYSTLTHLREALAQQDAARFRDRAHYLKGSSMMLGAKALSQQCARLEGMGRDGDLSAAAEALEAAVAALSSASWR